MGVRLISIGKPPPTRGHCIAGTPETGTHAQRISGRAQCECYACPHNLLVQDSGDVPGRRHRGLAPEWTLRGDNTSASAPSCALDIAAEGEHSSAEVARIMGMSKRRVEQIIAKWKQQHVELAEMGSAVLDD